MGLFLFWIKKLSSGNTNWNIYIFLGPMGMGGPGGGLSALMGARPSSAQSTASEP